MAGLAIWAFGPPRVEREGVPISVDTRKAVALLVYLAVEPLPRSRDALAALLWPDYDQAHARATLRRTLSALMSALHGEYLRVERETIAVADPAAIWLDVAEFHSLLASCAAHGHASTEACPACVESLAAAAALYRDDFLAGFGLRDSLNFEDWQTVQRESLRREAAGALERLVRAHIAGGSYGEAIPFARRWLALDRLHEPAHRFLMRLYDWTGQHAAALKQYRECAQVLERELGVAPLAATTGLYEAIKAHRAPPPPAARMAASGRRANVTGMSAQADNPLQAAVAASPTEQQQEVAGIVPLVGRAREWEAVCAAYHAAEQGGHLLVIEGEAGIGKTRLAEELAGYARRAGAQVLAVRCYDGEETLAYAPISAALRAAFGQDKNKRWLEPIPDLWLSEAARLLPELRLLRPDLPSLPRLESAGAQGRFFEGLRQVLLAACAGGGQPGTFVCDDAQWADDASLEVLGYLARRMADRPLCLVLTWRSDSLGGRSAAGARALSRHLLADAQKAGHATHVRLERLSRSAVREWIERALDGGRAGTFPELAERLYGESEGLPLFVAEYARALAEGSLWTANQTWTTPGGVRELLRSRLRDLDDASAQVLTAGAILGRSFDFDTVREVSGRSEEETVEALEALTGHGLLSEVASEERGEPTYDFTHEKLRALITDETSLARQRLLHRRAAQALEQAARRPQAAGVLPGQIARHHLAAGDRAEAAAFYKLAGERARTLYANTEALRHLELALALGHPDRGALHEAIGDVQTLLGAYAAALASYAAALAEQVSIAARAYVEHKLGEVYARRGDWEQAEHRLAAALAGLESIGTAESAGERARVSAEMSLVARHQGGLDEAQALAERALALATEADDNHALAQAHNMLGILASGRGEQEEAVAQLEESLALAERLDDPTFRAAALNNLALALNRAGDLERARALAEMALGICAAQGDRHHEAALHNNLADLLHAAGRAGEAMEHLKQAVTIYAEIGVEAGAVQPEIWKLAEW